MDENADRIGAVPSLAAIRKDAVTTDKRELVQALARILGKGKGISTALLPDLVMPASCRPP